MVANFKKGGPSVNQYQLAISHNIKQFQHTCVKYFLEVANKYLLSKVPNSDKN